MLASRENNLELVKFLLMKKVPINKKDKKGNTPLKIAFKEKNFEMVTFLHRRGATMEDLSREEMIELSFIKNANELYSNKKKINIAPLKEKVELEESQLKNLKILKGNNESQIFKINLDSISIPKQTKQENENEKKNFPVFDQDSRPSDFPLFWSLKKEESVHGRTVKCHSNVLDDFKEKIFQIFFNTSPHFIARWNQGAVFQSRDSENEIYFVEFNESKDLSVFVKSPSQQSISSHYDDLLYLINQFLSDKIGFF